MNNNFKKVIGVFAIGFAFRYLIDILDTLSNYVANKFSLKNNNIVLSIDQANKNSQVKWAKQQQELEPEELSNPIGFTVDYEEE